MELDFVARFRSVRIIGVRKEESALAHWVADGVNRCRVGFLPRHLLPHRKADDGRAAQIVAFLALLVSPSDNAKSHLMLP